MKNGFHCSLTDPLGKHHLLVVAPGIYFSLLPGSQDLPILSILLAHCSTQVITHSLVFFFFLSSIPEASLGPASA